jgi:hypothetical protein
LPPTRSDLLLVLATVIATLAIHRQFAVDRPQVRLPRRESLRADPPEGHQAHLQPSAESPIEIKPAGWKENLGHSVQLFSLYVMYALSGTKSSVRRSEVSAYCTVLVAIA